MTSNAFPELFARYWTAFVLVGLGTVQLWRPRWFDEVCFYARRVRNLPPDLRVRVQRVLDARETTEGSPRTSLRWLGACGIAMGLLELVTGVQFAIPYAVYCLATSVVALVRHSQIRRGERRAAPLVARRAVDAWSPPAAAALLGCFAAVVVFGCDPRFRIGAIAVGASMLVLMWIGWRTASGRALIYGDDPEIEYAVDARVRALRVNSIVALGCAPAVVLIGMASSWMTPGYETYGTVAFVLSYASFGVAMLWMGLSQWRFGKNLVNHV
jgi:hypothetical protein